TSNRPQTLDLSASVFGGYDDDIFARGAGPRVANARIGGTFIGSQASANYVRRFQNSTFSLDGASAFRWLPTSDEFVPTFYSVAAGYAAALDPRTNIALRHSTAYQPFFSAVPFAATSTV